MADQVKVATPAEMSQMIESMRVRIDSLEREAKYAQQTQDVSSGIFRADSFREEMLGEWRDSFCASGTADLYDDVGGAAEAAINLNLTHTYADTCFTHEQGTDVVTVRPGRYAIFVSVTFGVSVDESLVPDDEEVFGNFHIDLTLGGNPMNKAHYATIFIPQSHLSDGNYRHNNIARSFHDHASLNQVRYFSSATDVNFVVGLDEWTCIPATSAYIIPYVEEAWVTMVNLG